MENYEVAEKFVSWIEQKILFAGRGDNFDTLDVEPSGKFWIGRIAPEDQVIALGMGDRGERLEPCAIGLKIRPAQEGPWTFYAKISCVIWQKNNEIWTKSAKYEEKFTINFSKSEDYIDFYENEISEGLTSLVGEKGLSGKISVERKLLQNQNELTIQFVNTSQMVEKTISKRVKKLEDFRFYEATLNLEGIVLSPFYLEALPDSFRYNRKVWAYGINTGVKISSNNSVQTIDMFSTDKMRPDFWPVEYNIPELLFEKIFQDPIVPSQKLFDALLEWGNQNWSKSALEKLANEDCWTEEMLNEAIKESEKFDEECERIKTGIALLNENSDLKKAFSLMNKAMSLASSGKYNKWRPFQFGFLLANLESIASPDANSNIVDIVWFATGGGKTETYLGILITAALYDRINGKISGITAWSRFPLRMLSLQQTQRFANALASAEIVRREHNIQGDPFSMGFFVGDGATPNSIRQGSEIWNPDDDTMPTRLQILEYCPFCKKNSLKMIFNRKLWKLEHQCQNAECNWLKWKENALPFYIVDEEIYRFLPTVVVGTLDKAALISMQASMRGFVAFPLGLCSQPGHGYTYAKRSKKPNGCLVPDCNSPIIPLPQAENLFSPSFRLQDELHLLRDSLGAIDAHYEAIFDGIQEELTNKRVKILASSATLTGYKKQSEVLYRRNARVFPQASPSINSGFWSKDSKKNMRRYVAIAPRGVTIEYTVDQLLTEMQKCIRNLKEHPKEVCHEIGVPEKYSDFLLSIYGTNVVYGNTLRDLDAVVRSMETQVNVEGKLGTASLTGRTDFEDVRKILKRLEDPEPDFFERIHLLSASSMMSHGVDVDRLNIMVMLGLPLSTAEFIQATARVGRKWPGLVFVVHKIGRERDASVFRSFNKFIEQGDRFIEVIPISRRSRRVLERTISGFINARILMVHEPNSKKSLVSISNFKKYISNIRFADLEFEKLTEYLKLFEALDEPLKEDIRAWLKNFLQNVKDPPGDKHFLNELFPTGSPMRSLRDVEEQAPIFGSETSERF